MSTSQKPDPTHVDRAGHLGGSFDHTITQARETFDADPALDYLAHYSSGVYDFGIDRLDEPAAEPDALPTGHRAALARFGRSLSFTVNRLDRNLQEVRTGGLIRVVLHTDGGAAFCNTVVPKENLVGLVLDEPPAGHRLPHVPPVRETDRALSALATTLRGRVSLSSGNPGGWETVDQPVALSGDADGEPFVTIPAEPPAADGPVLDACRDAVRGADLQLVAYCPGGEVAYVADQFEHTSLGPFFTQITATARRKYYQDLSRELGPLAVALGRTVRGLLGGSLLRMILDVEQGAVYYYRLRAGTYLVGVTLDQSMVAKTDDRMAELAESIREL